MIPVILDDVQKRKVFDPATVSGLEFFGQSDQIGGLSDDDLIATWLDQSGNGRNVTQATGAKKPTYKTGIINGLPVVRCDGSDDYLQSSTWSYIQPITIFVGLQIKAHNAAQRIFEAGIGAVNRCVLYLQTAPNYAMYAGSNGPVLNIDLNPHVICCVFNGASSLSSVDGGSEATGDPGASDPQGITIGANNSGANNAHVDYVDFLIYNSALSVSDKNSIGKYIAGRIATAWTPIS